jgi:hypothetical protein
MPCAKVPSQRKELNFSGVPGEIVAVTEMPSMLIFGRKPCRLSPYDPLLKQLAESGAGKILRFGDAKCRTSIGVRARRLGLRVSCAEDDKRQLWVRFDGRIEEVLKSTRREKILTALKSGPMNKFSVAARLREQGDGTFDAVFAEVILSGLVKTGEVIRREGDTWALNPAPKTLAKAAK